MKYPLGTVNHSLNSFVRSFIRAQLKEEARAQLTYSHVVFTRGEKYCVYGRPDIGGGERETIPTTQAWEVKMVTEAQDKPNPPPAVGAAQDPVKHRHVAGFGRSARALVYLLVHHARAAGFARPYAGFIHTFDYTLVPRFFNAAFTRLLSFQSRSACC